MIIAITKENEKVIRSVSDALDKDLQIINGINNLKKFVIQEMRSLNNYAHIIIDMEGIKDEESEIVDAIVGIKSMYNINIVILAIGYEYGNSLLGKLFCEGIYNFVTSSEAKEIEEEIKFCIECGKKYKDSVRYRQVLNSSGNDKIIIKKEYKKLKQNVTIGIIGSERHIGTTSLGLALTCFLNDLKMNACYIQSNNKEDIETLENLFDIQSQEGFISYRGTDMYKKDKTISAMEYGYDFYIYDYGNIEDVKDIDAFLIKDVKIVVSGTKSWEQDNLMNVFEKLGTLNDVFYVFNFTPEFQKKQITENMGELGMKTFFSNYMPDPFEFANNEEIYNLILKDYIAEKSIKTEVIPIEKKKNFFSKLLERKKES